MAQGLETAIRADDDVDSHLDVIDRELKQFLANLNAVLPAESQAEQPTNNEQKLAVQALPELIAELGKNRESCVQMSETLPINDVENLANSIQKLGENYQYGRLVRWGEELAEQTSMFNLDKISILLNEYPNLIAELKTQEAT